MLLPLRRITRKPRGPDLSFHFDGELQLLADRDPGRHRRYLTALLELHRGEDAAILFSLSPEYLAVNPKGRVPALVTESGTLTETPALLCFVAQRFPQAELAPLADPFALAQVQEFNSYLCSTVHVAHAHRRRGTRWADDALAIAAMKRKVPSNLTRCF